MTQNVHDIVSILPSHRFAEPHHHCLADNGSFRYAEIALHGIFMYFKPRYELRRMLHRCVSERAHLGKHDPLDLPRPSTPFVIFYHGVEKTRTQLSNGASHGSNVDTADWIPLLWHCAA